MHENLLLCCISGIIIIVREGESPYERKRGKVKKMTRLELLAVLLSLKAVLEESKPEKALEIINALIEEAKKDK